MRVKLAILLFQSLLSICALAQTDSLRVVEKRGNVTYSVTSSYLDERNLEENDIIPKKGRIKLKDSTALLKLVPLTGGRDVCEYNKIGGYEISGCNPKKQGIIEPLNHIFQSTTPTQEAPTPQNTPVGGTIAAANEPYHNLPTGSIMSRASTAAKRPKKNVRSNVSEKKAHSFAFAAYGVERYPTKKQTTGNDSTIDHSKTYPASSSEIQWAPLGQGNTIKDGLPTPKLPYLTKYPIILTKENNIIINNFDNYALLSDFPKSNLYIELYNQEDSTRLTTITTIYTIDETTVASATKNKENDKFTLTSAPIKISKRYLSLFKNGMVYANVVTREGKIIINSTINYDHDAPSPSVRTESIKK